MTFFKRVLSAAAFAILGMVLAMTTSARAETLDSRVADTRMFVGFKVDPDTAQVWLPQGHVVGAIPKGPFATANFVLVFIDRLLHLSPDGEPKGGGAYRMLALVIPGENVESGERAMFIARIYGPHDGAGPYANSVKSVIRRELSRRGADLGPLDGSDSWEIEHDGGRLVLSVDFEAEVPKLIKGDSHPVSAADPEIRRIYRYQQLMDVVRSAPADIDRITRLDFEVSIPELVRAFDGSEALIGVGVIPWYTRETYLP